MSAAKTIVITGVSTGIGYGTLKSAIAREYTVYGSVRSQSDADRLSQEFGDQFIPLVMDVTDSQSINEAVSQVEVHQGEKGIDCLVNNAGIAIGGPLQYQSMEEIRSHFEVNVFGLIAVTKAFLPLLGARPNHPSNPGKIINISSVAGRLAQPFVGAYVASKHAVEGFSHSLRRELLIYGIDVIIVGPGAVSTPIWDKGINMEPYQSTPYGKLLHGFAKAAKKGGENGLSIDYIGNKVIEIISKDKPKVRYALVPQKWKNWTIPMLMSHRMLDGVIKKMFGLK